MARKVKVNMTGVESYTRCPEGEWLARLKKIELDTTQSGDDALKAQFEVIKGTAKGNTVFETFSLGEKALWKLKSFLDAAGLKSDGKLNLDLDKLEGKTCIIEVTHDEYNGNKRAKIASFIKPSNDNDEDEEDEEDGESLDEDDEDEEDEPVAKKPAKKGKKPVKKGKKPEPEEDDDEDDEDEDDEDEDEDEDEPPRKSKKPAKKPSKPVKNKKKSKKSDPDEDDDWEDDDDE